ncbi:MAG: ABC transporter substrate-binding protein [Fimbriimonadaceae bacterium]|nr:ABC transporter substrate-binding protein [Fimbriimonadaceae bacterium]
MNHRDNYWNRLYAKRLSRRTALGSAALTVTGAAGLLTVGCGGDDDDSGDPKGGSSPQPTAAVSTPRPAVTVTEEAKSGGRLTWTALPTFTYQHLDPHATIYTTAFTFPTHSLLAYMDDTNPDGSKWEVKADAAESWETPDATTYIFKLRSNLKFHNLPPANGRNATSEDVKFSLDRIGLEDPHFFRQNDFKAFGMEVTTPDASTVVIKFPKPMAAFWNRLTTPGTVIMPTEIGTDLIVSTDPLSGTGPFMHKEFTLDRSMTLAKNPEYSLAGQPYLDEILALPGTATSESRMTQFKAKQTDTFTAGTVDQWNELKSLDGVVTDRRVGVQSQWVVFNTQKAPFDDPRVRKALSLVLPRQEIVDIAHRGEEDGVMQGPGGLNPWVHGNATFAYDELKKRPGYRTGSERDADITEAKKLLEAAGATSYSGTLKYTSQTAAWPFADTLATLLQEAFNVVGFDLQLQPFSYADTLVNLPTLDWDIYHTPQYANGHDPDDYLDIYFTKAATRNYSKWQNDEYNALYNKQNEAATADERNTIIKQMLELLDTETPRASSTIWTNKFLWWDRIQGYHGTTQSGNIQTQNIWVKA